MTRALQTLNGKWFLGSIFTIKRITEEQIASSGHQDIKITDFEKVCMIQPSQYNDPLGKAIARVKRTHAADLLLKSE